MSLDAATRVRANEAVFDQAWGTISTMAYDALAGVRFDGRYRAAEWTQRKRYAFSVDERRFETPAGTREEIEALLDAIDDRWAAFASRRPSRGRRDVEDRPEDRRGVAGGSASTALDRPSTGGSSSEDRPRQLDRCGSSGRGARRP